VPPATISDLRDSTTEDAATGAVRSIQTAEVRLPETALRELWSAMYLERLARTYWRFLTKVTLGLVRVRYSETGRALVLLAPAIKLIAFASPEYELEPDHGIVRWRITKGLLVARRGHESGGYLQIEVRRLPSKPPESLSAESPSRARGEPTESLSVKAPGHASGEPTESPTAEAVRARAYGEPAEYARLHVEVAVEGFYPAIASGLGRRFYRATQSKLHVLITHAFLRSLARLDLADRTESGQQVGRFAG
jgi:hypothetical protein